MRLDDQRESDNVEDRRGGGLSIGRGGLGLGGMVLALVVSYFLGVDLAFYRDLKERFKAPGEFAQAYVVAHEVGHHVQNLLGIAERVQAARRRTGEAEGNALSVRLELQADCFAGIWGKRADTMKKLLEPGEIEQALVAAAAIGDDRLQQQGRGMIVPESFTHGSSAQRVRWFRQGFESGDAAQCDTFKAGRL